MAGDIKKQEKSQRVTSEFHLQLAMRLTNYQLFFLMHLIFQLPELLAPSFKEDTAARNRQGLIKLWLSNSRLMLTWVYFDEVGNLSSNRKLLEGNSIWQLVGVIVVSLRVKIRNLASFGVSKRFFWPPMFKLVSFRVYLFKIIT